MSTKYEVQGFCDERFSLVKEEFAKNFEAGMEVGATFAATLNGEFVVDIWAGFSDADQNKPWEKDTIVNVWSTTKIMAAICTHMLIDRGLLDLDGTVSHYWPEFAQSGKESILIRHLLSHQAGLSTFDQSLPKEAIFDWDLMTKTLGAQKPDWEPGTKSGYHAFTQGFLLGEVVRRVTGKSLGTFFREEIAAPLEADFYIGLPDELESRVAEIIPPSEARDQEPGSLAEKSSPVDMQADIANLQEWRKAEIPAANGHSNARSVARILSALACGGEIDGVRLLSEKAIETVIEEQYHGIDLVLEVPMRYGLGFGLTSVEMPIGPNPRTFFWGGWGGSAGVVDLDAKLSFSYVMNKMGNEIVGDTRVIGPAFALYGSL